MDKKTAIEVNNLSKVFDLPKEKESSIKSLVVNFWRRDRGRDVLEALSDINFEVKQGEFFGIVGRNGSGKSTLLKTLAGIYAPTRGSVNITGKLVPFIELGVGFNPELTGRENVYLNGSLLGFSRKEIKSMYKDIVDFAELHKFMDQKLKNYSSGMHVRLAFSIAIRARSDILLLDEVLAVGDTAFQQKCFDYFIDLKKSGTTVCLVTHDMGAVKDFCDRALILNNGKIEMIGNPNKVAVEYEKVNFTQIINNEKQQGRRRHGDFYDISLEIIDDKRLFKIQDEIRFNMTVKFKDGVKRKIVPGVSINRKESGQLIAATNLYTQLGSIDGIDLKFEYRFSASQLTEGAYDVDVFVLDADKNYATIIIEQGLVSFRITEHDKSRWGAFNIEGKWNVSD